MKMVSRLFGFVAACVLVVSLAPRGVAAQSKIAYGKVGASSSAACTMADPCSPYEAISNAGEADPVTYPDGRTAAIYVDFRGASVHIGDIQRGIAHDGVGVITLTAWNELDGSATGGFLTDGHITVGHLGLPYFRIEVADGSSLTVAGPTLSLTGRSPEVDILRAAENGSWYRCREKHPSPAAGRTQVDDCHATDNDGPYPDHYKYRKALGLLAGDVTIGDGVTVFAQSKGHANHDNFNSQYRECAYVTDLNIPSTSSVAIDGPLCVTNTLQLDGNVTFGVPGYSIEGHRLVLNPAHNDGLDPSDTSAPSYVINGTIKGNGKVVYAPQPEVLVDVKLVKTASGKNAFEPTYRGFSLSDKSEAFNASGSGMILTRLEVAQHAGIVIDVPFGAPGLVVREGVLWLDADAGGYLTVAGAGQVNIGDDVTIPGDVLVHHTFSTHDHSNPNARGFDTNRDGTLDTGTGTDVLMPIGIPHQAENTYKRRAYWVDRTVECFDGKGVVTEVTGSTKASTDSLHVPGRRLTTGVHVYGNATIAGNLTVDDVEQHPVQKGAATKRTGCQGGVHIVGPSGELTVQGGLLIAKNAAQIAFPNGGKLNFNGRRFDTRGMTLSESQFWGSGASTTKGDVCTAATTTHPATIGSLIEFQGTTGQSIFLDVNSTLTLDGIGIVVDLSTNWASLDIRGESAKVKADAVFVDQGNFITGGKLGVSGYLHIDQSVAAGEGQITSGLGGTSPFLKGMVPHTLTVTGDRASIDHRGLGDLNPTTLIVSLGTASSIWTVSQHFGPVVLTGPDKDPDLTLYLRQGRVWITDGGSIRAKTVHVGKAGVIDGRDGDGWIEPTTATFQASLSDGVLTDIVGSQATLKAAVAASKTAPNVTLDDCAVDFTLKLGPGYNPVKTLTINGNNRVDFAGQKLVPYGDVTLGQVLEDGMVIEAGAFIDTSGDSTVPVEELQAVEDALAAFQGDDTDATRVALTTARDAYVAAAAALQADARAGELIVPADARLIGEGFSLPTVTVLPSEGKLSMKDGMVTIDVLNLADREDDARAAVDVTGVDVRVGSMSMGDSASVALAAQATAQSIGPSNLIVGGDLVLGDILATLDLNGNNLTTVGEFTTGSDAAVDLAGATHTALGDVAIGPVTRSGAGYDMGDDPTAEPSVNDDGQVEDGCVSGTAGLHFMGASLTSESDIGNGTVTFAGSQDATVDVTEVCSVTMQMASEDVGITIPDGKDMELSKYGKLTMNVGLIHGDVTEHSLLEERHSTTGAGGNTVTRSAATASRISFVTGTHTQPMSDGTQTGGVVWTGDEFSLGAEADEGSNFFRPITVQNHGNAGQTTTLSAMYAASVSADEVDWPADNLVVDAANNETLTLDAVSNMFWKVTFDVTPPHHPNISLAADGLHNIFDIQGLRIVQWDCDGTSPRLAGVYDVNSGPTDDDSDGGNDFINGVPHLAQEGVDVDNCALFGIAANALANPIHLDPILGGTARVQFIHNVAGSAVAAVDLYLDDNKVVDDFAFQTARPFGIVAAGTHKLDVVLANAPDNSAPLFSQSIRFRQNTDYHVIAHGNANTAMAEIVVREGVRTTSALSNTVDFYLVHGAADLGMVDLRTLDPIDNTIVMDLLANNFDFKDVGSYLSLDPGGYNIEVTTANNDTQIDVFRLELEQYADLAVVLNMSGPGKSSGEGLTMMGVPESGNAFFPQVITSTEGTELPTEFALIGNYPNPFNPSTRIAFDLPETAQVSVTVFDLLGRSVLVLPAQELEAGQARSIELNASSLSSGNYFYRVVATGAGGRHVESGRMLLIK